MRNLYLIFFFLPSLLFAQQPGWQEFTISDGLSQGMIFDIKQDRDGFIWVATKDGLNRYDGHNFTVFTHDPYNKFSISDNNCSALLVDSKGRLWVGTLNQGVSLFDVHTQRFYHVNIKDQAASNEGNYGVQLLVEDPAGDIWVATDKKKLFKLTLPQTLRTKFPTQSNFTSAVQLQQVTLTLEGAEGTTRSIDFGSDGTAIVGSTYGLYTLNWRQPTRAVPLQLAAGGPYEMYKSYGSKGWFAASTQQVVCSRDSVIKTLNLPRTKNTSVSLIALDANTLAVATTEYLWKMSPSEFFDLDSLTAANAFVALPAHVYGVTDLLKDQTGNIWVGTSGYGLRKFNPQIKQFHSYLSGTTLSYLLHDQQGRYYARHEFAYGEMDKKNDQLMPFLANTLSAADRRQRYMMQDRNGYFWVSNVNYITHEEHLYKFSPDWQLLKSYPLPFASAFGFVGNRTVEDTLGTLWIGATNGRLIRFNPATETFKVYSYQHLIPRSGAEVETFALYFDGEGTLWIGTQKGLIRAEHPQTALSFTLFKNDETDRHSLSNDFVSSMLDDPYQPGRYLWVSTKGGGLERLDKQSGKFRHFTEAQGLPNKVVYGILADEFNTLWMSTNRGLAHFDPKTFVFRNYTKADGLQDDEFNTNSFFKTASGELLFGGVNGLTAFRAGEVGSKAGPVPQVHIIGLKVNNEPVTVGDTTGILIQSIEKTSQILLSYFQNLITVEFGLMDFTNSEKNQFRYRLIGIDNDWVQAGNNRFANYAQLPDGTYTLQVEGSADGSVWSKPKEIQIRVMPPFYRSWWAYLIYAVAFAVIAWQLYRFQTQRWRLQQQVEFEKKEAIRLAELDALKTQFFANISHEFRTPLTLILGPAEEAMKEYASDERFPLIQRNANRLLSLINQLLDLSKLEAGQLRNEPERGDLAGFLRMMASSFSSLANSRQINFIFTQKQPEFLGDFDRDKLEKIVSNLLANAFKFTPVGKEVKMEVKYPGETATGMLEITIEDSGIGIAPQHLDHIFKRFYQIQGHTSRPYEGTGIGLALVHELVKVLDGTIQVASTQGVGTLFTVALPLTTVDQQDCPSSPKPEAIEARMYPGMDDIDQLARQVVATPTTENILLIVDDNADIRAYIRSIFQTEYQIMEAVDGQDGLAQATASLPTVVICDLMMPLLDGFGFCKALKTQEATSHIPVVMLTAKATLADRLEGFELGADEYLTKPFNRAEIQVRVRNLVQLRARMYESFAKSTGQFLTPSPAPEKYQRTRIDAEREFLDRLSAAVLAQLDNPDFGVESLAQAANMSRTQLHRKLKALTNTTASDFIRQIRLVKAAEFLQIGDQNVTQVAYAVGYDNLSYFAKVFQEHFGILPSNYGKVDTPNIPRKD